jgi:hypothetical protein
MSEVPFAGSLCHRCEQLRLVHSGKGSTFLMCQDPTLPKYPRQPVVACVRFVPPGGNRRG